MTASMPASDQLFLDDELVTELETTLPEVGMREVPPWVPGPEDEERVNRYLRGLRHYSAEIAAIDKQVDDAIDRIKVKAQQEIERLEAWNARESRNALGALDYMRHQLRGFSEAIGRVTRKSPFGSIKWKKGSTKTVVVDPVAFCKTHKGTDLVRVKPAPQPEPDLPAIARHIKAQGEIPEGSDRVTGPSEFVIDLPSQPE